MKKLRHQNRCYQRVVDCFKHEMVVMSEQLVHLQDILNLSNQSCREENGQLYTAVVELQKLREKLQKELRDAENKVLIENQKNQLKAAKIDELQIIIGQKNADLNVHDEAINEMKIRLDNALMENHELQNTIVALNTTIMQLQVYAENPHEMDDSSKKSFKSQKTGYRRSLSDCGESDKKIRDRCAAIAEQTECVKRLQKELERIKDKYKEKVKNLKRQNEELKDKLATSELSSGKILEQLNALKEQTRKATEAQCGKEQELTQCKQIIIELRQNLIELNESLADCELHHMAFAEEYYKTQEKAKEDIYLSCRCEIVVYRRLAEGFKEALAESKKKLTEMECKNKCLCEELQRKTAALNDTQKIDDLKEALKEVECRNKCLCEELQRKEAALNDTKLIEDLKEAALAESRKKLKEVDCKNKYLYEELQRKEAALNDTKPIEDLKEALTEYKKKLKEFEYKNKCLCEELKRKEAALNEIQITERLKETLMESKKQLKEVECKNKCLCEDLQRKEAAINEVKKRAAKKEQDLSEYCQDLEEKLKDSQTEEKRLSCFIERMKQEVQKKIDEKREKTLMEYNTMSATQQEINSLKVEIKNMIENQLALNNENDKLLKQVTALQDTVAALEEKNRQLKQKLGKLHCSNKCLKDKNSVLSRTQETLSQTVKNLEIELNNVRDDRDQLCAESRHVINNVKTWLEEQKKINERVKKKTRCYCNTIAKLRQQNDALLMETPNVIPCSKRKFEREVRFTTGEWITSEDHAVSDYDDRPISCSVEEWYSPTYRDDDETEDNADIFVNTLEALTR